MIIGTFKRHKIIGTLKRHVIFGTFVLLFISAKAQSMRSNHDSPKMNQFTVAEIGVGSLSPSAYYQLLHNNYQKTAAARNKLAFRTEAGVSAWSQVEDAASVDSAMTKRAEVEAMNVADRQIDVAWLAEKDKIESKMGDLRRNIDRIVLYGGSVYQRRLWVDRYNVLQTAVNAIQTAYMPNAQRKKQYLRIYADAARQNETLVRFLVYLSNSKTVSSLLELPPNAPRDNATHAAEALGRWRDAGWTASCAR